MSKVQPPTKAELIALKDDIQNRRTALLDKHGLFGGGELVNAQLDVLNKSYDKVEVQLAAIRSKELASKEEPENTAADDYLDWLDSTY